LDLDCIICRKMLYSMIERFLVFIIWEKVGLCCFKATTEFFFYFYSVSFLMACPLRSQRLAKEGVVISKFITVTSKF
jgi:hypothetical protein